VEVGSGINLPVAITNAGDGSQRLFVVEKTGRVWIVVNGQTGVEPFLDIRDRVGSAASEQGLLGLAFHPDYESNGYFFVYYTDRAGHTQVSRFQVSDDPDRADPDSEEGVLAVDQPASNHNGGQIAFGPDGALWIGLGDGGGAGDTYGNGQNKGTLLGSLLRIDVDELPYSVPADNPFVSEPGARPEIWAYGLRNPWRFSFDLATGDVYIADVGQNTYEEVNVVPASLAGLNYGWPIMEGQHCFGQSRCDQAGLTLPVAEYDHSMGCSVTGGYVYRGQQFPALLGIYFFGDYCSSRVWALARSSGVWQAVEVAPAPGRISTFGQAEDGEVYLAGLDTGTIYHLVGQ
jgi:glucose/arabinose dehydrogenase